MPVTTTRPPELALPVASLVALRAALADTVGPEAAAQALRQAGHAAGDAMFRILSATHGTPGELPADRFWADLARLFASRGWGHPEIRQVHDGVASFGAADWFEAAGDAGAGQPACHFTTGLLANMLGQVAGGDVAVLEVECRSRGDARCRFLFGGEAAVYRVYEQIVHGADADTALADLR